MLARPDPPRSTAQLLFHECNRAATKRLNETTDEHGSVFISTNVIFLRGLARILRQMTNEQ